MQNTEYSLIFRWFLIISFYVAKTLINCIPHIFCIFLSLYNQLSQTKMLNKTFDLTVFINTVQSQWKDM